jgi:hypothetical protein
MCLFNQSKEAMSKAKGPVAIDPGCGSGPPYPIGPFKPHATAPSQALSGRSRSTKASGVGYEIGTLTVEAAMAPGGMRSHHLSVQQGLSPINLP